MLVNVSARNFMSYGHIDLTLPRYGIVQIDGQVDENEFDGNGAGKTALVDLVRWTLFGEFDRGRADDVVNRNVGKDCMGAVTLYGVQGPVVVMRYRKHTEHKNNVYLWVNGNQVHGADNADTQKKIDAAIGMDKHTFRRTLTFDKTLSIAALSDVNAKDLFEKLIGLDLSSWFDTAKDYRKRIAEAKHAEDSKKVAAETKVTVQQATLENAVHLSATAESEAQNQIAAVQVKIGEATGQREQAVNALQGVQNALTHAKTGLESLEQDRAYIEAQNAVQNAAQTRSQIDQLHRRIISLETTLETPEPQQGSCRTCGQALPADLYHQHLQQHNRHMAETTQALAEARHQMEQLVMLPQDADSTHLMERERRVNEIDKHSAQLASLRATIQQIDTNTQNLQAQILQIQQSVAVHQRAALEASQRLEGFREELAKTERAVAWYQRHLQTAEMVEHMFSREGLRSFVLDTLLPYLNSRLTYYLAVVTNGKIIAEFKTTNTRGKERFHVAVERRKGGKGYSALSVGERTRLDLCLVLAIIDRIRLDHATPTIFFDELFDALDPSGVSRVIGILREIARNSLVVIISHSPHVRNHVDSVFTFVKENGVTHLDHANATA